MADIDYYFTTLSPYCYLAGNRLEQIAAKHGAAIRYKPLDFVQLLSRTGGTHPANRHPSRGEYHAQDLRRLSAHLNMPFTPQPAHWPVNMAPSSYAIIAAQEAGGGDLGGLVQGIFRATWVDERDISDEAVLRDLLAGNGFDPDLTNSGLFIGAEIYGRNLEQAVEAGAFGAPFYIVRQSGEKFWGQDQLAFLDRYLAGM